MKKTNASALNRKSFFITILTFLIFFAFTSCENFLHNTDTKNQIMDAIGYNNAPSYLIYLQANKGSGTIKILGEQISKKVTDTFNIKFEPENDHQFIKWEAVIPNIGQNEKPSDYIEFEDETSLETKVTFKKGINGITIKPVCPERLSVTRFNLDNEGEIYARDSSIVLTLNKDIPQECSQDISINIPGLPEGKSFTDYFQPAQINGKEITIRTKYAETHLENNLIPVTGSIPIHITIPARTIYYVNEEFLEPVSIYNDKALSFTYTINSETSKKTQIKFHIDKQFADYSTMRVNDDLYTEHPEKYSIGTTLPLSYKITDDYQFLGWKLTHSNSDSQEDEPQIFILPDNADTLSQINLSVTYKEDNLSQPIFTINNYLDGMVTIEPNVSRIPETYINIDGEHGTFTPGKGITRIKYGTSNHIEFDPASDYAFIRWQVINEKTNKEIQLESSNGNDNKNDTIYIRFSDINSSKTDYDLIQVPNAEEVVLLIKPVLVERPRVISNSPTYQSSGVLRDTTIQVMFDYNMNENSIYYTIDEIPAIEIDFDLTKGDKWLYVDEADHNSKRYGYLKDGKKYFKNISITNSRTDENLNNNFKAPVFENARTLSIPVDRTSPIDPGTRVSVTLNEGFFYKENNKDITMSRAEKWQYLVNGKVDNEPPTITGGLLILKDSNQNELIPNTTVFDLENMNTFNYFGGGKFALYLKATDNTAPDSSFNIICEKLYDENHNSIPVADRDLKTLMIEYNNPLGTESEYGFTNDNSVPQLSDCYLDELDDGIYSLYFEIKDGSGNKSIYPPKTGTEENPVYPKYYFCMDKTAPEIEVPTIEDSNTSNSSIELSWDPSEFRDYKNATVSYRKEGTTTFTDITDCIDSCTLNLDNGTHYDLMIRYYDYAGNYTEHTIEGGIYTRPGIPTVEITPVNDSTITLTCTKPAKGEFTDFNMILKGNPSGDETINFTPTTQGATATIEGLDKGIKYEFNISSYYSVDNGNEEIIKYSLPYKTEGVLPSFTTKPNTPKNVYTEFNSNTTQGIVKWSKPENGITGYIIYCSTDSQIPENDDTVTQTYISHNSTESSALFQNLTPGTNYYIKAVSYFGTTTNQSEPVYLTTNTKCAPVTGFTCTAESNTVLNLNWTAPAGNFDSYTISYKPSSVSSWTAAEVITQTVNKTNTNARIENLSGGSSYDFKIVVNGLTNSSTQELTSCKTCPNAAGNFVAEKVNDTSFKVTWTTPTGNYDGYRLYYSNNLNTLNSATPVSISKGTTTKTITGISQDIYYIKLVTYIDSLTTETTPVVCSLSLDNVKNPSATPVSTSSIKLTWTNPSSEFEGINIYKGNQLLTANPLGTNQTEYVVTNLLPNQKLDFNIETIGTVSGQNVAVRVPVTGCTYSNPVTSFTAEAIDPTTVRITYEKPENGTWTQLYIYKDDAKIDYKYPSHENIHDYASNYNITGGTTYTFKIKTLNQNNDINTTQVATATVTTPPKSVSSLTCSSLTQTKATLSWSKPDGNYTGVKVYYKLNSTNSWTLKTTITNNTTTKCSVEDLSAGSCYDFMVETYLTGVDNIDGTSQTSITGCNTKPNAPTNFALSSRTTTSLNFTWTKPSGNFTGYRLYYKKTNASSWSYKTPGASVTSFTLDGLSQGSDYYVYLDTYYSDPSNYTSTSTLTKATNPGTPGSFTVKAVGGDTKLTWTAPSNGVTKYKVSYRAGSSGSWTTKETTSTSYTFANTTLTNGTQYQFYVQTLYTANSETLESSATTTKSFYTPPKALGVTPTIYCDDGMGRVILRWENPPGRTDISGINIYLDNNTNYTAYINSYTAGYVTKEVKIPNYTRGSTHTFYLEPYHYLNNSETRGPKNSESLSTSSGDLKINNTTVSYSSLKNIVTSSSGVTVSVHPVDGGSFVNGRNVTLTKYSLGNYEVTNALWYAVTGLGYSDYYYNPNKPKTNINWQQAIAFCNKLSAMQGLDPCYEVSGISDWKNFDMSKVPSSADSNWYGCKQNLKNNGYHLPTCAQWELAARGGNPDVNSFFQGVSGVYDWAVMPNYVVYGTTEAANVGSRTANQISLYDMVGNVWELLTDWYNTWPAGTFTDPYCERYYHTYSSVTDAGYVIPYTYSYDTNGNRKYYVYRAGGCYVDNENTAAPYNTNLRVIATYANWFEAETKDSYTGFRLCRNVTY